MADVDEELARLRERAYGSDADIADDPAALARLQQLENARSSGAAAGRVIPARPPVPPLPDRLSSRLPVAETSVLTQDTPNPDAAIPVSSPSLPAAGSGPTVLASTTLDGVGVLRGSRAGLARVLGVGAVAACVAAAVSAVLTFTVVSGGSQPYAVLQATDAPATIGYFDPGSEAQRFDDFLGLKVTVGETDVFGRCIVIELGPVGTNDYSSSMTRGNCAAPGFEPLVDLPVSHVAFDADALEELGDVSGLRFEVVGDEVWVYVARVPQELSGS